MKSSHAAILAGFFLFTILPVARPPSATAEVVKLRDGREILCKVVREDETRVWVRADTTLMVLDRSQILTIESGLSQSALMQRLEETLVEARRLLSRGRHIDARRKLERELWKFEQQLGALEQPSTELLGMRRRLRELHYAALANDPDQRKAQELYEKALDRLNRIDYPGAYDLLMRATSLAPNRLDIQFHLAETAEIVHRLRVAMNAYKVILHQDYLTYYDSVARSYLSHLLRHGRQSLAEDRGTAALPYYEEIILLQGEEGDEPVTVATFGERLEARGRQSRVETLVDILDYAKPRVMVDLARAAIEEALRLDPENEELGRSLVIWKFLSLLKRLVEEGRHEEIVKLKAELPAWALEDPQVQAYIAQIEGLADEAMKARMLLEQAEAARDEGDCAKALPPARKIVAQFPDSASAKPARAIIAECEGKMAVHEGIAKAESLLNELKIREAEALMEQLLAMGLLPGSEGYDALQALKSRIEREREAAELWDDAAVALSNDRLHEGTMYLEKLTRELPQTKYGRYASLWLSENAGRLERRGYVLAHLDKGLSSIVLDAAAAAGERGTPSNPLHAMSSLEALIQADRPSRGVDWLLVIQIVVPTVLSLFILVLLLRKLAWPGAARFGLQLDEYFESRRFRSDPWGSSEEIPNVALDEDAMLEPDAGLMSDMFADQGSGDDAKGTNEAGGGAGAADAPTLQPVGADQLRARIDRKRDPARTPDRTDASGEAGTGGDPNRRAAPNRPERPPADPSHPESER